MDALDVEAPAESFDEGLWNATVETLTVMDDGKLVFRWKDGNETTG